MTSQEFAQKIKAKYPDYADIPDGELVQKMLAKYPDYKDSISDSPLEQAAAGAAPEQGYLSRAWGALSVPEQMSRQGLNQLAGYVPNPEPTGNMAGDLARGSGRVFAESLAEAAPGFVGPASLLTSGALGAGRTAAPLIKGLGRTVAGWAEAASGLENKTPGILGKVYNEPSILWGPGKKAAGKLYESALDVTRIRPEFAGMTSKEEFVKKAAEYASAGNLSPEEALVARQTLDKMKNSLPAYSFNQLRMTFDSIAKPLTKSADLAFGRAVQSEAARMPLAVNKTGGMSIGKLVGGSLLGVFPNVVMSPFMQAATAAGLGGAGKLAEPLSKHAIQSGAMYGGLEAAYQRLFGIKPLPAGTYPINP